MRQLFTLFIGLIIGAGLGLLVGWVIAPVEFVDSPMKNLAARFKDEYTVMVAAGYSVDRDLSAAVERLTPLNTGNVFLYVRDVTERYISQSGTGKEADIRNLVILSCDMGYCTPPMQPFRNAGQ
jgi:hypothetical protein